MAKNKGTFGKAKSTVEEEDEFVQSAGRIATALKPHTKKLVVLTTLVLVAAIAFATWDWFERKKTYALTHELSEVMHLSQRPVSEQPDAFATQAERTKAVLGAFEKLYQSQSTHPAMVGKLVQANALMKAGKYDDAIAAYRDYAGAAVPDATRINAREGIGYALEAKAMANEDATARKSGLEEALTAYEQMQSEASKPGYKRALYHQGRILAALERSDEAIAKFREILDKDPGQLEAEVENRLAALENKKTP